MQTDENNLCDWYHILWKYITKQFIEDEYTKKTDN
jgi:hypothetical protein